MRTITDEEKLNYLNELLETNKEFKINFFKYFNLQEKVETSYINNDLKKITDEIFKVFNNVDLEIYLSDCNSGYGGYYDYYEEDISEDLCESLFLELDKEINIYIKKDDFYQVLFILLATAKAIELNPNINDDYGLIYDYNEILSEYHATLISKFVSKLKASNISIEDNKKFVLFLLDNSISLNELKKFEELFDFLILTKEMALFLSSRISEFDISVQLKILNLLEDDKRYINTAKLFYKKDIDIAHKLLKKLNDISAYKEYEIIAKECFEENPNSFVSEIFKVITYDQSEEFYLKLLKYKVLNYQNINEYILYKKYLEQKDLEELQDNLCNKYTYNYCIQILEYEKKYDKILKLAQSENNIDLHIILKPIKFHYPKECLEIIINNCNNIMSGFDRNRNGYNRICGLLNLMIEVPNMKNDIDLYIQTTFINRRPRLPALIDELKKARLI